MRSPVRAVAAAACLAIVGACGGTVDPGTTIGSSTTTIAEATTTATSPTTSSVVATTTTSTTTTSTVDGWTRIDLDPSVLGDAEVTDAAFWDDRLVVVGCGAEVPLWWADEDLDLVPANGPADVSCIEEVTATSLGWYALGEGAVLASTDGVEWTRLHLASDLGYEFDGQVGSPRVVFASPDGDRVVVLFARAAEAESTVATLVSTVDGVTWTETRVEAFDSSTISVVTPGGDGLLAAGASPGGEFVPTAAVFTSADGIEWRRVTPSTPDYTDKVIVDLRRIGDRYVAVGGDYFQTGLMTAWTSADGLSWERSPHPDETTDPSVAQMTATSVTGAEDGLWAAGVDFDARRSEPQALPALWRSVDGIEWDRVAVAGLDAPIPFEIASGPGLRIGVWPPPGMPIDEPPVLFGGDPAGW